jgi:hypothetical protein
MLSSSVPKHPNSCCWFPGFPLLSWNRLHEFDFFDDHCSVRAYFPCNLHGCTDFPIIIIIIALFIVIIFLIIIGTAPIINWNNSSAYPPFLFIISIFPPTEPLGLVGAVLGKTCN